MAYIVWKQLKYGYYAYLQESNYNREIKGPVTRSVYLGSTPKKAEIRLRRLIRDEKKLNHLISELYSKSPKGSPYRDEKSTAVNVLKRIANRFRDEEVKEAINAAIEKIKDSAGIES